MKYFGIDRVKEPVGTIPSTAWRLDNSRMVGRGEFIVRLKVIKLEGDNFNQICSASDYNEQKVKEKLLTIVSKRGKLQNPYTESSGIICGTIEEIGSECSLQGFKVGDEIISLTSISGIPVYIDSIKKVDYDYGEIWCDGYAIMFEAAQIAHRPDNVDISMIFSGEGRLHLRLNEREGRSCKVRLKLDGRTRTGQVGPYSIVTL